MDRSIYLLATAIFSIAAPAAAEKYVVKPKATKRSSSGLPPTLVTGTFELKSDRDGSDSKSGGACLVFRPASPTKTCQSEAECVSAANELFKPATGAYGYCVERGNPGSGKICWYKPPDSTPSVEKDLRVSQYCVRSGKLPHGEVHLPAVHAFPRGVQPTYWRVTTCQSLAPNPQDPNLPGCASVVEGDHKAALYGPERLFP